MRLKDDYLYYSMPYSYLIHYIIFLNYNYYWFRSMIFNNLSYSKKLLYLPVISLGNMRLHLLDLLFSSSLSLMMYFSKADNYDGFY